MCSQCPAPVPAQLAFGPGAVRDWIFPPSLVEATLEDAPKPKAVCPSYTRGVFSPETFPGIVDWAAEEIVAHVAPKIGAVAGCGHSGILVAAAVGYKLRLPVIAVRKAEETGPGVCHDSESVNAILQGTEYYAIIDDLVATGRTIQRIVDGVARYFPQAKPALLLLYNDTYTSKVAALPAGTRIIHKT
jgi:adenine/guanine phosphoribosyltransferase-like PRPP-binding protein